jgi:hypothetical protein
VLFSASTARWSGVAAAVLAVSAFGCGRSLPASTASRDASECPKLESALLQLSRSADPEAAAAQAAIPFKSLRARVIVQVRAGTDPRLDADLEIEARYADQIQGWARFDRLCALSQDPAVVAVAPARAGTPLAPKP